MRKDEQPLFGDVSPNNPGNNGYGYEEHEQYIGKNEQQTNQPNIYEDSKKDTRIQIKPGLLEKEVMSMADDWRMTYLGDVYYDNGEEMTQDNLNDIHYIYFENTIESKTRAFMNKLQETYPDVEVQLTDEFGPEYSQDMDMNRFGLNFEGLTDDILEQ